ncbi:MAG TPA: tetratricopeptide repeat protein, partial [Gemmatimonadales bacterium]|nr:tetratricopeptide repeat protein [Gemmatimonadales bacterium]
QAPRSPVADPDKVVVFPLVERGSDIAEGTGQEVALLIGSALEHTEPLRWIDGWTQLDAGRRADVSRLTAPEAIAIARDRAARYYVDGAVVAAADSYRVVLRLNDASGDSLIAQASASAPSSAGRAAFPQLGLRAVNQLLPRLLEPGRRVDLAAIADRNPAAIANWLQGEREYRRARYVPALEYQRRAIEADSALAFAALKGAQAAEWEHDTTQAAALVEVALRNEGSLPPRYRHFALGLRDYYASHADSALGHLQAAIALDSTWAEAWASLGELRYHLHADAESLATEAFTKARQVDPEFAPPLLHLAELALRARDTARAAGLVESFRRSAPDSAWLSQLDLSLQCLRRGPGAVDWSGAAARHAFGALAAAKVLAAPGTHLPCAEAGFRAVLAELSAPAGARWGALLGLQGVLTMRDRMDEVKSVLDSAVASGMMAAQGLYVVHANSRGAMEADAARVAAALAGDYGTMGPARLWYLGLWQAHVRDTASLRLVAAALAARAAATADPFTVSTERGIAARLALLEGDSARAILLLHDVSPTGSASLIEWGVQEPFGGEQLLLAQLLLATGRSAEAMQVASRLDSSRPIIYLMWVRESLQLRMQAARMLERGVQVATY